MTERPATLDESLRSARANAFGSGEFVGQESFVSAGEVLSLACHAEVRPGVRVLDLCCGGAGAGLHIVRELGGDYVGVDSSARAISQAQRRAASLGLKARFEVMTVPPIPAGPFDVILLLETLLAFQDKSDLMGAISAALPLGGRFACTVEEGAALTAAERASMPASDTVWPIPLEELLADLRSVGMRVRSLIELSDAHLETVDALVRAYAAADAEIAAVGGTGTLEHLLTSHRLWSTWLRTGRIRKFGLVAERVH